MDLHLNGNDQFGLNGDLKVEKVAQSRLKMIRNGKNQLKQRPEVIQLI